MLTHDQHRAMPGSTLPGMASNEDGDDSALVECPRDPHREIQQEVPIFGAGSDDRKDKRTQDTQFPFVYV
jgi:hypothetical protein